MTWISSAQFWKYAKGKYVYMVVERRPAEIFAKAKGGEVWTEHDGEGASVFYSKGHSMVNALGCVVVLDQGVPMNEERQWQASRIYMYHMVNKKLKGVKAKWGVEVGPDCYSASALDEASARAVLETKVGPLPRGTVLTRVD